MCVGGVQLLERVPERWGDQFKAKRQRAFGEQAGLREQWGGERWSVGSEGRLGIRGVSTREERRGLGLLLPASRRYPALPVLSWPLLQCEPQRELPGVSQVGANLGFRA